MSCVVIDACCVEGGASQSGIGPRDHCTDRERRPLNLLPQALSPAAWGSGRRRHLLSPRRRRSIQKRSVIELVSEHDVEPAQELPRHRHFPAGTAASVDYGVVETFEIRIAHNRRLARLAEQVPEEGVTLFGNPAKPAFPGRGLDRRSQPDVAHGVLARSEASRGTQRQHAGDGRQWPHARMRNETPGFRMGVGGLFNLAVQPFDVGIQPPQDLETLALPPRRVRRQPDHVGGRDARAACTLRPGPAW